ncbi:MAG: zinc ribbon domain-containing protein [Candidatus Brocadiia bacterium]
MRVECECGHTFEILDEKKGDVVNCPACGRPIQTSSPEDEGGELDLDWGGEFALEGQEPGETSTPEPPEPEPESEPETGASEGTEGSGEMEFDWDEGFTLEGEKPKTDEPEPTPPSTAETQPREEKEEGSLDWEAEFGHQEQSGQPAAEQPEGVGADEDLGFSADEFSVGTSENGFSSETEGPIELSNDQIMDYRKEGGESKPPQKTPPQGGEMKVCPECGAVTTKDVIACPECGADFGGATPAAGGIKGSYWGSFAYAYLGAVGKEGWKYVGMYVLLGVFAPMILVFIPCVGWALAWGAKYGAIVGAMYSFMGITASKGSVALEKARKPSLLGDMIEPAFNVGCASLLVWIVLALAIGASIFFGTLTLEQLTNRMGPGEAPQLRDLLRLVGGASFVIVGGILAMFLWPMILMILGASQSVVKALNPINTVKAIAAAPGPYLGICLFFWINYVLSFVIRVLLGIAVPQSSGFIIVQIGGAPALAVASYMGAVNGWRMGVYLYKNNKVFDHV